MNKTSTCLKYTNKSYIVYYVRSDKTKSSTSITAKTRIEARLLFGKRYPNYKITRII